MSDMSLGTECVRLLSVPPRGKKEYKLYDPKRCPLSMAFSSSSFACLSFVQNYFDFVGLVLISTVNTWVQYQRLGLKRITPSNFPAVRSDGDLAHHLCRETRERKPNAIKNVWRMAQAKGPGKVITLANGKRLGHFITLRGRLIPSPFTNNCFHPNSTPR